MFVSDSALIYTVLHNTCRKTRNTAGVYRILSGGKLIALLIPLAAKRTQNTRRVLIQIDVIQRLCLILIGYIDVSPIEASHYIAYIITDDTARVMRARDGAICLAVHQHAADLVVAHDAAHIVIGLHNTIEDTV